MGGPVNMGLMTGGVTTVFRGHTSRLLFLRDPRLLDGERVALAELDREMRKDEVPGGFQPGPSGYGLVFADLDGRRVWSMQEYSAPDRIELIAVGMEIMAAIRTPVAMRKVSPSRFFTEKAAAEAAFRNGWVSGAVVDEMRGKKCLTRETSAAEAGVGTAEATLKAARRNAMPGAVRTAARALLGRSRETSSILLGKEGWLFESFGRSTAGVSAMAVSMWGAGVLDPGKGFAEWDEFHGMLAESERGDGETPAQAPSAAVRTALAEREAAEMGACSAAGAAPENGRGGPRI